MLLEVACFNFTATLQAYRAGADRIELCDNVAEGGTTVSRGTLIYARNMIPIPIFPMIRPRGGDFVYSNDEFEIMKKEVLFCKELGFEGLVLGCLTNDGDIQIAQVSELIELAYPLEVTFHKAFDRTREPLKALEQLIALGCSRILTSGQKNTALAGCTLIAQLCSLAEDKIIIMPGGGVRANNLQDLITKTKATEYHSACRAVYKSQAYSPDSITDDLSYTTVDISEIKAMKKIIG